MSIKNTIILGILIIYGFGSAYSQENNTANQDNDIFSRLNDPLLGANLKLYQDPELQVLIDRSSRINKENGLQGYRVQIFSGSGQDARKKTYRIKTEFSEKFPDFDEELIYNIYQAPFFKLRLGDFRNKNEAVDFLYQIKEEFPNSYIVKTTINYPKLEPSK